MTVEAPRCRIRPNTAATSAPSAAVRRTLPSTPSVAPIASSRCRIVAPYTQPWASTTTSPQAITFPEISGPVNAPCSAGMPYRSV